MRKTKGIIFVCSLALAVSMMALPQLQAQSGPEGDPPDGPHGLFGMPPFIYAAPGDSIFLPVEFFDTVPSDSQITGISMTIRKDSGDLDFGVVDTAGTVLHDWTLTVAAGSDSLRIELTAPSGKAFTKADTLPVPLFHLDGTIAATAVLGDSIDVKIDDVSLVVNGSTMALNDSMFHRTKIYLSSPPPPDDKGDTPFALFEAFTKPDSAFKLDFAVIQPVPADSQLNRIRAVFRADPPYVEWAETGHLLGAAVSGWSLTTTVGDDSIAFDLQAPTGEFLVHDSEEPLVLVTFAGHALATAPDEAEVEVRAHDIHLTVLGVEKLVDEHVIHPGKIWIGDKPEEPGPPHHSMELFALFDTFSKPDSAFALDFMVLHPVPADSQVSRIRAVFRADPPYLEWASTGHELAPDFSDWSLTTSAGDDSIAFDLQAPDGQFLVHDNDEPLRLVTFVGQVKSSAPSEAEVEVRPHDVWLTSHGVEEEVDEHIIHPGKVFIGDMHIGPPPGGGPELFALFEAQSKPDSVFAIDFAVLHPVPADSQLSRIRMVFHLDEPFLEWSHEDHELASELSGWTLTATAGEDSFAFDLQAPDGAFLEHDDDEPFPLVKFVGRVKASAPDNGKVHIMPKEVFLTAHGVEQAVDLHMVRPGVVFIGDGIIGPPPPPPLPPTATTEGRTNLGLYGGTVLDMAFDEEHGIMLAAVAAPQSVFASADSGLTWYPAFPTDSLEFITDFTVRGFGGRAMEVEASGGYCYARTSQEAGTLTGSQVSEDGENWRTLLDPYLAEKLLHDEFGSSVGGPLAVRTLSTHGAVALVGLKNFVFRTTDAGRNWDISIVPEPSALGLNKTTTSLALCPDDASGKSFYVVLGDGFDHAGGLFYRTDDGEHFTRLFVTSGGDTAKAIANITVHPYTSDTLWVTAIDPGNPTMSGTWRSYDGGTTWTKVFDLANPHMAPAVTLYEDPKFPDPDYLRLFLVGENKYSDDLGDTWTDFSPQNDPFVPRVSNANAGIGHIPNTDIYFSQGDGAPGRSTDGLEGNYFFVPTGIEGITVWDIAQIPDDMDKVYLATSVGIAYTSKFTDTTLTATEKWASPYGNYPINPSNGGNMGFTAIAIDPENTSHIVAANGNGIFVSESGGFTNDAWSATAYRDVTGLDEPTFKSLGGRIGQMSFVTSDSVIAAAYCEHTLYGALLLSTDGGYTWQTIPQAGNHNFRTVIAAWNAAQDSVVLFAGGGAVVNQPGGVTGIDSGAVYKSLDRGVTWDRVSLAPNGTFNPAPFPLPVNELAVKPGSLDTLYMACGENLSNAIVRTYDGGHTLESISMEAVGPREGAFEAVAINKNHPDSIYFAVRRDILVYDAVANSTTTLFRGYPGELTHTLLYDELTMGSSSGFYAVESPVQTPTSAGDTDPIVPSTVELSQNYPNPFNPSTNIAFTLSQDAQVTLEIFNLLGQRVTTLISEPLTAGKHTVQWRPQAMATGVYFYRLRVTFKSGREQILSKKLMFIK